MDDRPSFLRCFLVYVPLLATFGALTPSLSIEPTNWHWYSGALAGAGFGMLWAVIQYESHGGWGDD